MKPYEILELSKKSDIQTVERRFMHLCSILQNNENSMGNNLDKYNEYEKEKGFINGIINLNTRTFKEDSKDY